MSGRHAPSGAASARAWAVGLGAALLAIVVAMVVSSPASAASTTVNAQLSLSGLADANNPTGGSQIGVHPGDKVNFKASTAPTAGLDKLGLGGLVGGLLDSGAKFQVTADFSGLPGGHANTKLVGSTTAAFRFGSTGTYHFTWTAQKIVVGVLGTSIVPINLNGNQLANAGVKLNAKNQYVGSVVVATNPPKGGISVQLPSGQVAPSAPVVGQLPTVSIPGVQLPTVGASVPNLLPGGGGKSGGKTAPKGATAPSPANTYKPPAELVPDMVVPHGDGGAYAGSGGGFALDTTNGGGGAAGNQLTKLTPDLGAAIGSGKSGGSSSTSGNGSTDNGSKPIDLASSPSSPSGQLPVLLAILAIVALAIVAGTYARLYLLGRNTSAD